MEVEEHSLSKSKDSKDDKTPLDSKTSSPDKSLPWYRNFPFSVLFIVGNEFCERFSYYGMRAVLVLFLNTQLLFDKDTSTALYHTFVMLCYLLPVMGAIISDSCLGKYLTILSLSCVYVVGNILVSGSAIPFDLTGEKVLAFAGLFIIAIGTGGIKPCVSALGGDQFKEGQTDNLRRFFSLFYFSINAGSVFSTLLTPVLRSYINCFNTCQCFALAFGVPAVLMIISLIIFVIGTKFYVIKKPKREAIFLYLGVPHSIALAIYRRIRFGSDESKKGVLQYAVPTYTARYMEDVRLFLRVLVMLLPLPVFWALFDQQGSRWTLQATAMNGQIGSLAIQPDQMQALNPILILVFIPIFEFIIYPLFAKCHLLKRPLQRMVVGMAIAGSAFLVAGFIQLSVDTAARNLHPGQSKLVVVNSLPQDVQFEIIGENSSISYSLGSLESNVSTELGFGDYRLEMTGLEPLSFSLDDQNITQLVFAQNTASNIVIIQNEFRDTSIDGGKSSIQVINALNDTYPVLNFSVSYEGSSECAQASFHADSLQPLSVSERSEIDIGSYQYFIMDQSTSLLQEVNYFNDSRVEFGNIPEAFSGGATYTLIITGNEPSPLRYAERYNVSVVVVDPPNSISMFLQIPMYVLITAGEVMFSVTGLEFAYSQAPESMKAMCQAAWLLTVAFGNLVVIIVAEARIFDNQAIEFFFFTALIGGVTIIFAIMSFFYKYVDLSVESPRSEPVSDEDVTADETSALVTDTAP